ncbi:MAG: response regulator [Chloroflexi bacterium]|nr:response regulator [Chloroflexota bacterium]
MDTPKKLVLTIEDQPAIADLLVFLLDASELEVKRSDNGAEGLAMVKELKPDLVIMDVMMPILDGWQVFDAVRQDETTQNIPIIMLSVARQDPERRTAFRGSQLDFYMTKPFDVAALRRMVEEVLGLEIWTKAPTPPVASSPTATSPAPATLPIEPSPTIESPLTATPPSSATPEPSSTSSTSNTPTPSTSPVPTATPSAPLPAPSVLPASSDPSTPPAESPALPTPPITISPPAATEPSPPPQVKE